MKLMASIAALPTCLTLSVNAQQPAGGQTPPAATEVLERMDKEIVIAKTKAITSLEKILKDTTKKGDLQGALATKAAIERLQGEIRAGGASGIASGFVGKWAGAGWTAEAFPDGTILFSNGVKGAWKETGNSVYIECDNGDAHEVSRSADGYSGIYVKGGAKGGQIQFKKRP